VTAARAVGGLAAGVVLTLVAGCGGGSSSSVPSASGTATSPPVSAPTATTPAGPGGAHTSYPPATGSRISLRTFTARAPHGWTLDRSFGSHVVFAGRGNDEIEFSELTFPQTSLRAMAKIARDGGTWQRKPAIRAPVTIDGTRFYHLAGPVGGGRRVEEFGAVRDLRRMKVSFELTGSPRAATELVGSVLATVRVR
jgi:hypothetical protein